LFQRFGVLDCSRGLPQCEAMAAWQSNRTLGGSGLVVAEKQFRRIDGHRALPGLLAALEADLKLPKSAARVA